MTMLNDPIVISDEQMRTELNKLRIGWPDAQVYTYTYNPLYGVTSETDPRGYTIYYEYDAYGRLLFVRDKDGNVLKNYIYSYKQP